MRISQPNYEKSSGKEHFFERVILARTLEWRGTLVPAGAPTARVPGGLPTLSP